MGLYLYAKTRKGLTISYIHFGHLRQAIVRAAYDVVMQNDYEDLYKYPYRDFDAIETGYWNAHCNDDLDLLIWHSDCDGTLSSEECKRIYGVLKDMELLAEDERYKDTYEKLRNIIKHCAESGETLIFG